MEKMAFYLLKKEVLKEMKMSEIKKTLDYLIDYKDCEITHTFNEYTYRYCEEERVYYVKNNVTGETERYNDIETCSTVLYELLNNNVIREVSE
jgi:hypothetical protein